MILMIQEIHAVKKYKLSTLYLAISLLDRYLVNIVNEDQEEVPCLITLAVTSLLLAAKLE